MENETQKNKLSLHIKLGSAEFSASGDREAVQQERATFFSQLESYTTTLASDSETVRLVSNQPAILPPNQNNTPLIFSSFSNLKKRIGLLKDVDLVKCAAYYLQRNEHKDTFMSSDIKDLFQRSRVKVPKNISRAIGENIAKGFIAESDERSNKGASKLYYAIDDEIEKWIEQQLSTKQQEQI